MDIILLPGLWLRGDAWSKVESELVRRGHTVSSMTLPGQGDGLRDPTLQDQIDAVVRVVDDADDAVLVVGHSAASALAWIVADVRPERVAGVLMIGGMPVETGKAYANFFPMVDGAMPFPGWEPFEGADSADLDDAARDSIAATSVPVPEGVCHAEVALTDERRFDVPVTLVCPEFSPAEAKEWIDGGFVPELTRAKRVTLVNIDSGHWPMVTAPRELAAIIGAAARPPIPA